MQGLVETGSPKKALSYVNFKVLSGSYSTTLNTKTKKSEFQKNYFHSISGVILSWALTIPVAMGLSSVIFLILKALLVDS